MSEKRVRSKTICAGLLLLAFSVVLSCAHAKFTRTWKDPEYSGNPRSVLVHVFGNSPTVRTLFENRLADQLKRRGVTAVAGHEFLPDSMTVNRDDVNQIVRAKGIDAVFVVGPTNRKDLENLRPGELSYASSIYEGPAKDYNNFSAMPPGTVYSASSYAGERVTVEMVLYDARSNKRIWSAMAEATVWDSAVDQIQPLVDKIVETFINEKIIR